uniref:Reverse transcriptase domain-containing protein n=1 Tax=Tanacetum cinerariifolium TaxID=118510 RepID=A0A6L2KY54_TANCI|nr:reverse transcriptase domain-containing protein [Tanacetum cinerariifolium]
MMTATTTFIRGETAAASKKKVHTPLKSQDQSKRHTSERRSDFQNQPEDGRGSNKFIPVTKTPKEILAAESRKFKPPPPMLRKKIEELVRAGKLSHFIKEIRQDRDQQKTGKKDASVKDKATAIYMIQPWGRRALYKSMDEFYDSEITVTVQRYHWKAWDKRNPSSTIHAHGMLKFPVNGEIVTICSTNLMLTECATIAAIPKDSVKKAEARHKIFKVAIHPDFSDQEITIGGTISTKARTQLCTLLKGNLDIFTSQLKKGQAMERAKAIQVEVQKEAGILREVDYHDWLSNPVMKLIEWSNPSAVTPLSVSWTPTKAIIKYRWRNKMRKRRLSTPITSRRNVSRIHDQSERIKSCPDKTEAVLQLPSPQKIKEILADFLVEKPKDASPKALVIKTLQEPWTLFTNGSSCVDRSGTGLILTSLEGTEFTYALKFQFTASNNEAEYETLIAGLWIAAHMGVHNVYVSVDSKLVANQVLRTYVAKEENMIKYLEKAKSLNSDFVNFSISQVPISKNKKADALTKIASTSSEHISKQVLVEVLKEKSIQEREMATIVAKERPT